LNELIKKFCNYMILQVVSGIQFYESSPAKPHLSHTTTLDPLNYPKANGDWT